MMLGLRNNFLLTPNNPIDDKMVEVKYRDVDHCPEGRTAVNF